MGDKTLLFTLTFSKQVVSQELASGQFLLRSKMKQLQCPGGRLSKRAPHLTQEVAIARKVAGQKV